MADIIDTEEVDRDIVEPNILEQQFEKKYNLLTETAVSPKKTYINKLHGNKSLKVAVSLSDSSIEVYQLNSTSLMKVCRLSGHQKALTEVVWDPKEEPLLYSTGEDGLVKLWDTRTSGSCVQEYKDEDEPLLRPYECMDVSCNGRVLCAGSEVVEDDAYLVFWDQRLPKPLGGYWNCHMDDITQVKFHNNKTEIVATGSLDGLINIFNILEQTEDDALMYSLNVENSTEKLSWIDEKHVACITQSNDLQLWDADNGDLVKNFTRDKVARSIKRSKGDDCYLVDVYSTIDNTPVLLAGSYAGDGNVLRSVTVADKKLQPSTNFSGNKQTVRCCWYDEHRDIVLTAGEAGLISAWGARRDPHSGSASNKLSHSLSKLRVNRHRPY